LDIIGNLSLSQIDTDESIVISGFEERGLEGNENAALTSVSFIIRKVVFGLESLPFGLSDVSEGNGGVHNIDSEFFIDLSQRKFHGFSGEVGGVFVRFEPVGIENHFGGREGLVSIQ